MTSNKLKIEVKSTRYGFAGEFKLSPMPYDKALAIAEFFWDVESLQIGTLGEWCVKSRSGFVANVGRFEGSYAIVNRKADGGRELLILDMSE